MEKCKYCESNEFILEPKNDGEDIITANMVALKCNKCGKWLKWVKKEDRRKYISQKLKPLPDEFWVPDTVDIDSVKEPPTMQETTKILDDAEETCYFTDNNIDAPQPTKEEFAINILNELRRELLLEQTYFRSNVIGAIDSKIKKLRK